jgi:hypothetical protein
MMSAGRLTMASAVMVMSICASVLSATAQATGGPRWFVAGSVLTKGKTVEAEGFSERIEIEATHTLESSYSCRAPYTGEIIGGEPGTDKEALTFTECELESKPGCEINGQPGGSASIVLSSPETELVYLNSGHTSVGDLYTTRKPPLATIALGSGCPVKTTYELLGSAVAKVITGVGKYQRSEDQEFLASGTSYEAWEPSTSKWISGTSKLELGGFTSRFSGVITLELPSRQEFMVE